MPNAFWIVLGFCALGLIIGLWLRAGDTQA